ncbi:MAG: sodium:proton exchanger [Candidatus Goldiibacteriota bacterium HGW-Goldbacteria-1]|jgi:NhaP-type Na+/H+ or K+/H+ antiporter|nr:MAG: sodium:proton exchanger [Candidatus Goldiibacteriota bacterium HGW-Goldbacteria-1]
MEFSAAVLFIGLMVFFAHFFSATFNRTKIPDVLPLVIIGILAGPVFNFINPEILGRFGEIFSTLTLVIILFEAGLCLDISVIRSSAGSGAKLAVFSFLLTFAGAGFISYFFMGLELLQAAVFGAILGGGAPSIVIPIIKKMSAGGKTASVVVFESTISEVLSIVIVLQLIATAGAGGIDAVHMSAKVFFAFLIAVVIGVVSALFWSMMLNRIRLLENSAFTTPAFVFIVFGGAEIAGFSGAIAALCFGIMLGNMQKINVGPLKHINVTMNEAEKSFMAEAVFLMRTFFFLYIGISIKPAGFDVFAFALVITAVIYVARVISAQLSFNRKENRFDVTAAGVMVSRGLASAVLAGIPLQAGMEGGEIIRDTVYAVILLSILLNSFLSYSVERQKGMYRIISAFFSGFSTEKTDDTAADNNEKGGF